MLAPITRHPLGLVAIAAWTLVVLAIEVWAVLRIGWHHPLWCSHVGLVASAVALWWPHRLLVSCAALAVFVPESVWTVDVGLGVVLGDSPTGATSYMFGDWWPLDMQLVSLFHLVLPPLLWWQLRRVGYDRRALWLTPLLLWPLLLVSRLAVDAEHNVNWVYDFGGVGLGLPGWWQLILVGLGLPLVVYLPSHLLFGAVFGRSFAGEVEK